MLPGRCHRRDCTMICSIFPNANIRRCKNLMLRYFMFDNSSRNKVTWQILAHRLWLTRHNPNSTISTFCNDGRDYCMFCKKSMNLSIQLSKKKIESENLSSTYRSVNRLHRSKFKSSIKLHFRANILKNEKTVRFCVRIKSKGYPYSKAPSWILSQPRRLSCFKNPPHRLAKFSTTVPWKKKRIFFPVSQISRQIFDSTLISFWNWNKSTLCQLLPSSANKFHARHVWAHRHKLIMSKYENTL